MNQFICVFLLLLFLVPLTSASAIIAGTAATSSSAATVKIAFWQPSTGQIIAKNVFLGDYYLGRYDPGSIIRYENGFVSDQMEDTGLNVGDA